jgi:hypothetical protein
MIKLPIGVLNAFLFFSSRPRAKFFIILTPHKIEVLYSEYCYIMSIANKY